MFRYPTGLRAKSSVGWFPWVFCPCSLQGRQHFHSSVSLCLHLSLASPSLHISVSPALHCPDLCSAAALQRDGWCWCKCTQQLQLSQAAQAGRGRREEGHFFIQHFEQQLAGVWLCSHSSCLDELGREGIWLPSQRLLPIFLGLAVIVGADLTGRVISSVTQVHPETSRSEQLAGTSPPRGGGHLCRRPDWASATSPGQDSTISVWELRNTMGSPRHEWAEALNSFNALIPSVTFLIWE